MNVPDMLVSVTPAKVPRLTMKSDPGIARATPLLVIVPIWCTLMQ